MTLVRFNNTPASKSFNNLVDDFFTGMPSLFGEQLNNGFRNSVPVNISEVDNGYQVELVAPGFDKEDFKVNLEKNLLTISAEKKSETEDKNEKQIRREYKFQSFTRSFNVDEKIDTENIVAKYLNGVLTLNLPKKADVKEAAKQITIA